MEKKLSFFKRIRQRIQTAGNDVFLCDTCKYDYPNACNLRKRPNAKICGNYSRK